MIPHPLLVLRRLESQWARLLSTPVWYLATMPELQRWTDGLTGESIDVQEACKKELYDFFERHLTNGNIALGHGRNRFDSNRQPIDTIVIHHTSNPPGLQANRLSAIELIRLYAPYFANPDPVDRDLLGRPIFSGHMRGGKEVFWPYHWIIRTDGRAERLLEDREIGWHAGDWSINCRSIAIVLDGDYEWHRPSDAELTSITRLISEHYSEVPLTRIVGHREVNPKTICPSNLFLDARDGGWKSHLIGRFGRQRKAA